MSSESDGGESPKDWTILDGQECTEDSDDSSGSGASSDFVDLGEDIVQYHHIGRRSSVINIEPNVHPIRAAASSLPANFRAQVGASAIQDGDLNASIFLTAEGAASSMLHPPATTSSSLTPEIILVSGSENKNSLVARATGSQMSDCEVSASSGSTLVGSESPLLFSTGRLEISGNLPEGSALIEDQSNHHRVISSDGESDAGTDKPDEDAPSCTAYDTTSVDSIEILSMPCNEGILQNKTEGLTGRRWLDGGIVEKECKEEKGSELVSPASVECKTEVVPSDNNESRLSSPSEDSDTSEFERIDVDMIPSLLENGNQPNHSDEEADKMDVAGAIPETQFKIEASNNYSSLRPVDKQQNYAETRPVDQDYAFSSLSQSPSEQSPHITPNVCSPSSPHALNIRPWHHASVPGVHPFYLIQQPVEGHGSLANSAGCPVQPLNQPPDRFDLRGPLMRQHSNILSDDGFEHLRRPQRQDDDSVSTISSSSSNISGFVNTRQRHGPSLSRSVSQHHSDFDDENLSNFTDGSEDCLPANMLIPSRKSGVRQYKHNRDEGFNTTLDWLVFMVLLTGLAIGIGHFIGSSQEMAYQHSMNDGQVQRLRELQDDLVTCLDQSTGHNSKITTESSSPALQAIRLMEGLNSKMLADGDPYPSLLLEQEVGQEEDIKQGTPGDGILHPAENHKGPGIDKLGGLAVTHVKSGSGKDFVMNPQASILYNNRQEIEPVNGKEQIPNDIHEDQGGANDFVVKFQSEKEINNEKQEITGEADDTTVSDQLDDGKYGEKGITEAFTKPTEIRGLEHSLENDETNAADVDMKEDVQRQGKIEEDAKSVEKDLPPESSSLDPESETIQILKRKMELMEKRMDKVFQTAEHWQQMFEESKRVESSKEDEGQDTSHSSKPKEDDNPDEQTETEKDHLAGIAAALKSLWPNLLKSDHGNEFLQYLNRTETSAKSFLPTSDNDDRNETVSWSDAFYGKLEALKSLPNSEGVQSIVNNTKLLAKHLSIEIESVTESLRNQSAKLVEEHNIRVEGLGERANGAWTKLKNVTADVLDYNKKILSGVGEQLTDTLHIMENISAETIAKHNISLSGVSKVAEQVWDTMKNYSTRVTDGILNATTTAKPESKSTQAENRFGQTIKDAWNTVKNYSTDFTTKQNLSISGLREQVKAAWVKVKNNSAQVLEDISESNLAGKFKEGAQKLGEKVGTTFRSVKEKVKRFHKRKRHHGNKQHHKHFRQRSKTQRHEKISVRNRYRRTSGFDGNQGKHIKNKQYQHDHQSWVDEDIGSFEENTKQDEDVDSVPVQWRHQYPIDEDQNEMPHSDQDRSYHFSAPSRPQWVLPTHDDTKSTKKTTLKQETEYHRGGESHEQEKQHSVPSRKQWKQPLKSDDSKFHNHRDYNRQDLPKNEKVILMKQHLQEHKDFSKIECKGEVITEPSWEDLFDCMDMHCKGDENCMHSQRKDAARLYSELLDYQDWLKDRHLKKEVRELQKFLEELGEFLSETNTDDEDLDELKDEFGEMVQDMEERARKRQRKNHKETQGQKPQQIKDTNKKHKSKKYVAIDDETAENSTVVIDFKSLPQQKEEFESNQAKFSSQSPQMERRKYAGRGYQNTDDDEDWYLQRAKDRADQRKSHHSEESNKDNWYLHWVQGRINGRTGVTVWDMYEWIKERYMLREELRRHEMEDHTNWFLRRP